MEACARDFGVLVMPLSFFALDDQQDRRVRLSFSSLDPRLITEGIDRFARYVNCRAAVCV
jgi:(S)-3,5-dihydroxyphenylglycine transaminase